MRRIVRWLCLLLGVVSFSQLPEFTQQYRQRLSGATEALAVEVARFDADAARQGLSRNAALERYSDSNDPFVSDRGISVSAMVERHERLEIQDQRLSEADPLVRGLVLLTSMDFRLTAQTAAIYRPAVPILQEGLLYGGLGAVIGWVSGSLVMFRRRRSKQSREIEA